MAPPADNEVPIQVRMSFTVFHYGREDQIEAVREKLERELFLALSRPVALQIDSKIQMDLDEDGEG